MARVAHNRKTHETFVKEVDEILGSNYEVLTQYVNAKTKVTLRHSCGHVYELTPDKIVSRGTKCLNCYNRHKTKLDNASVKFYESFDRESSGEYELLSEYTGVGGYIKVKHRTCGHIYEVRSGNFIHGGRRCPPCMELQRAEKKKNSDKDINQRLIDKYGGKILLSGAYAGYNERSKFICTDCDSVFITSVSSLLNENVINGCPECSKGSSGEERIKSFLTDKGIRFKSQYVFPDLRHKHPLRFDFAILKEGELLPKLLIEFDGRQHFEPVDFFGGVESFELTKVRDFLKDAYCRENDLKLLRIPYWEYKQIENILSKEVSGF